MRGAEHLKQLETQTENSVIFKHKMAAQQHEQVKFRMEITDTFKNAFTRQANEAVQISNRPSQVYLNSKSKFNHPPTAQIVVEKKMRFQA